MKRWLKASFTVEYALIMPFVLMVIFFIIYVSFYLHDQVVLEAITLESLMVDEKDFNELVNKYTFSSTQIEFTVSKKIDKIQSSYRAQVKIPYRELFKIEGSQSGNRLMETDWIRAYKLVSKVDKNDG